MHYLLNQFSEFNKPYLISSLTWILMFMGLCGAGALGVYFYQKANKGKSGFLVVLKSFILDVAKKPLIILFTVYIAYIASIVLLLYFPKLKETIDVDYLSFVLNISEGVIFFWIIFNAVSVVKMRLLYLASEINNKTLIIVVPAIASSLYTIVFLVMMNILIPALDLPTTAEFIANKIIKVCLIGMLGWVLIQIIHTAEGFITRQYVINNANLIMARKINTQLLILKRILITIVFIVIIASILMMFDSVKNLGTGLLTTAGIISAVGAFASQQSLSRLFSGLLIAFTQPIRIGDTIIIENELGQVEEITLSYIVVKLWDLRRLILPTDYFTNKGLQNLTRESSELLGTIFIYADYTLPVDMVRNKFFELLNGSPLWNKKVASFHVTDIKDNCMELRGLMSAENSGKLWELRCEVREKLISFIVQNYPDCLSKQRSVTTKVLQSAAL